MLICHVELRSEESPDIKPYTHDRTVEKIVVQLGDDVGRIKQKYIKVHCSTCISSDVIVISWLCTSHLNPPPRAWPGESGDNHLIFTSLCFPGGAGVNTHFHFFVA